MAQIEATGAKPSGHGEFESRIVARRRGPSSWNRPDRHTLLAPATEEPGSSIAAGGVHHNLNRLIVELGQSLSSTPEGRLDIVYCWQLPGESIFSSGRTRIGKDELDRMLKVAERLHRRKLEEFTRQIDLSSVSHQTHLLKGDPGRVIPEFAKKKQIRGPRHGNHGTLRPGRSGDGQHGRKGAEPDRLLDSGIEAAWFRQPDQMKPRPSTRR